ncbi:MAG TPA: hypothetical protein VIV60_10085 [Polyangiaceae bacterium]
MTGMVALSVLGRRLSTEDCAVIDDAIAVSTLADPRIWPLKLTRLVASYGRAGPAIAAGLLTLEEARIGPWTLSKAAQFLVDLHARLAKVDDDKTTVNGVLHALIQDRSLLWEFGTPFRAYDERLVAFRECMSKRGRDRLPYWRTMLVAIGSIQDKLAIEPNISLGVAAAFLDLGILVEEMGPLSFAVVFHMFLGHGTEGARDATAAIRELPDEYVSYVGRPPRSSPRFEAALARLQPI